MLGRKIDFRQRPLQTPPIGLPTPHGPRALAHVLIRPVMVPTVSPTVKTWREMRVFEPPTGPSEAPTRAVDARGRVRMAAHCARIAGTGRPVDWTARAHRADVMGRPARAREWVNHSFCTHTHSNDGKELCSVPERPRTVRSRAHGLEVVIPIIRAEASAIEWMRSTSTMHFLGGK